MNLVNAGGEVFKVYNDGRVEINTVLEHPDYVFRPDYELMPLQELKAFVSENRHLPNIPTAEEVKENGLDLTGLSIRLLEKVEELTLYTISQQEQIDQLIEENRALRSVQ